MLFDLIDNAGVEMPGGSKNAALEELALGPKFHLVLGARQNLDFDNTNLYLVTEHLGYTMHLYHNTDIEGFPRDQRMHDRRARGESRSRSIRLRPRESGSGGIGRRPWTAAHTLHDNPAAVVQRVDPPPFILVHSDDDPRQANETDGVIIVVV